jgi:hypothetical protein
VVALQALALLAAGLLAGCGGSSKTTSTAAPAPATAPVVKTKGTPGWGAESAYLGRYQAHIAPSSVAQVPKSTRPESGALTLFMREVKKGKPLVPSGILALHAPQSSVVVYLTYLSSSHGKVHAKINGGSFLGPVIGSFTGVTSPGTVLGTARIEGLGDVEAHYVRVSKSPQP